MTFSRPTTSSDGAGSCRCGLGLAMVIGLALTSVIACTGDDGPSSGQAQAAVPPDLARFYEQPMTWRGCSGFSCAEVSVPLNYDDPGGDTIELALVRLPTTGERRLGSLVVNPGGPGGSGVWYARQAGHEFTSAVLRHYDLVGVDPRGVGRSAPIDCVSDAELDQSLALDGSPDTPEEELLLLEDAERFAAACAAHSRRLLPHVGTADVARDLDVVRAVLGDERLNYLGKSYGTRLGATYAELFPGRVGAMVLDGAVDPTLSHAELAAAQAKGYEVALDAFLDDCLTSALCPLTGPRSTARDEVNRLLARLDTHPLSTSSGREVTQTMAIAGLVLALGAQLWGERVDLRDALEQAQQGRGDRLAQLADATADRTPDGRYLSNVVEAGTAVSCLDLPAAADVPELKAQADQIAADSPLFGRYFAWAGVYCLPWPVRLHGIPQPIRAAGAPPILVVGTLRDPATPHQWAVALADQLDSGILLTWNGDGHTAYKRGSDCVDAVIDAYLLGEAVPVDGQRCD